MKLLNPQTGEAVYYHDVMKHDKLRFVIQAANKRTVILNRDRKKRRSRTFAQQSQAEAWLERNGYKPV